VKHYDDGRIYTGEWNEGKFHGKGKMEYTIEQFYREGYWKNDRMEGEHIVTYKNGEIRKQLWVNYELAKNEVVKGPD
jgi:hypothetical protein